MDRMQRSQLASQVTLVGAVVNALLALGKIVVGYIGHSQGLIADGVHSVSDLITDALVWFASRYGSEGADSEHPYGHRRIETAATVFVAIVLLITGIGITGQAIYQLIFPTKPDVHSFTLWVALISILANEGLFHYTLRASKLIRSELLRTNAWHHRSDAASSLVVMIGIIGSLIGLNYLDAIAAIIVGFMIVKMGWDSGWASLRELVDTGVDSDALKLIQHTINSVPGVKSMHLLRNRSMAGNVLVDVHVQVDPYITVSEGHYIATQVHYQLLKTMDSIEDVTVHIDPEDDQQAKGLIGLPSRPQLLELLQEKLVSVEAYRHSSEIRLHYLRGKVAIEIILPSDYAAISQTISEAVKAALVETQFISSVTLLFEASGEQSACL